jgi:hypothetical protein
MAKPPAQAPHARSADPLTPDAAEVLRLKQARNRASTARNWAKVENYLMEVEKSQGYAKSWALRERLEQGHVCLDDLKHR